MREIGAIQIDRLILVDRMYGTSTMERELYLAISNYLDAVDRMYAPQILDEEKDLERKLRRVRRAKRVADVVADIAKLGSIEENFADEAGLDVSHRIEIREDRQELKWSIEGRRTPQ